MCVHIAQYRGSDVLIIQSSDSSRSKDTPEPGEDPVAERNQQVMDVIVEELQKDPNADLDTLIARAREVDPSVSDLSRRQFHARYPLQAKRRAGGGGGTKRGGAKKKQGRKRQATGKQAKKSGTPVAEPTKRRGRRAAGEQAGTDRESFRSLFMEFAEELAAARTRLEYHRVIRNVDAFVDRAAKLAER
jgi:hypothetical protein